MSGARCSGGCVSRMKSSVYGRGRRAGAKMASALIAATNKAKPSPLNVSTARERTTCEGTLLD